jgi:RsbT co-antagonist protein rsbRD N-terminal domain
MNALADLLPLERERVLLRWTQQVAEGPLGNAHPVAALRGHMGEVLEALGEALREAGAVESLVRAARAHGRQRASLGLELAALAQEFGLLRDGILDRVEESSRLVTLAEVRRLTDLVDRALAESATAHGAARG